MKKLLVISAACLVLLSASAFAESAGSAFGLLTTADALGQGKANIAGTIGIADATSFAGTLRYGLSRYTDGRIKIGLVDPGNGADTKITFGADFMWQVWDFIPSASVGPNSGSSSTQPFDMAVGGAIEYVSYDFVSVLQIGGNVIGSYPVVLSNNSILKPYGRIGLRMESIDPEFGDSDSNLEFGLNAGVAWQATANTTLYGEFQLDGNDGLFLGIDFNVM
jgi:hypothetical protein